MEALGRIGKITADLLARVFHRSQRKMQVEQLAQEIVEYGRMNAFGPGDILIDVPEAALRLRESQRNVRQALRLLEMKGRATRTSSKDYWKLRDPKRSKRTTTDHAA